MAAVTEQEVAVEFQDVTDRELIKRCVKLCQAYGLSAGDLGTKWEVMQMNSNKASQPMTFDQLAEFELTLKHTATKRQKTADSRAAVADARTQAIVRPHARSTFNKDSAHLLLSVLGDTPIKRSARPSFSSPIPPLSIGGDGGDHSPPGGFGSRTDAGKVVGMLHPELGQASSIPAVGVRLELGSPPGASFMWERLDERARRMDEVVASFEAELIEAHGTKAEAVPADEADADPNAAPPATGPAPPSPPPETPPVAGLLSTGPEPSTFVGRVCCDGEGKLNPQSIFLEGSRRLSHACRVRLDLAECPDYALFPGQTIGVCGLNLHGHTLRARRIIPGRLPPNAMPADERQIAPESFNVMVAAGPFCTTDNVAFAPLDELLAQAEQRSALCLVLLGPFLDEAHPTVASGGTPGASFDQLFQSRILARIEAFLAKALAAGAAPHVVLVPSPRDVTALPVYPQPGFSRKGVSAAVAAQVHMAPNPARVDVGGVSIATCSVDTLMTLGAAELASPPAPDAPRQDRMLRLAAHVLKQRLFLPLLPPPADVPVDVSSNLHSGGIGAMPDILLLPSQLAPFAKLMPQDDGGALCLNPGKLTRNAAGGSFALLSVHPRAQIDGARTSDIGVRTAVQIVKI